MSEMRLQRALARAGVASRRAAETLIELGVVRVDGEVAGLGSKVDPARQTITVRGKRVAQKRRRWLAFHKPLGVVTSANDEEGRRTVFDLVPRGQGLTYVGRLDAMTTGLLLLTTDGEAVQRLTHPKYRVPRRYTALVHGRPTAEVAQAVTRRVVIEGRPVEPLAVRVRPGVAGRSIVDLTLAEGRKHIVRRWAAELDLKVERLARLQYGPVRLGDLPVGKWRELTPQEERALYRATHLTPSPD
ncbi:MAG TPA: pseudouridine synthase [Gemmatimonadales bacterium]|jgi:23S rRNA pseudouridine2605 synthase|nr:pseudouridine synthase [Gemmatimonadales bacterium]